MNASQYIPFFLTGFFPCFLVLVGMWQSNKRLDSLEKKVDDLNGFVRHFIDLHLGHESRISTLEERIRKP
jgi:hypothetical protein